MPTWNADVAIIGAGMAGLTAALEALRKGQSVIVIDREGPERFGGSAKEAFGGLFFVDSPEQRRLGIKDSEERAAADWRGFAQFDSADHWGPRWADHIVARATPDGRDYLKALGVSWLPMVLWVERGQRPGEGNSVPRFHLTWGAGSRAIGAVIAALEAHPASQRLTKFFGLTIDRIERQGGAVCGCSGIDRTTRERVTIKADAVILAAGGIGGNANRVREIWHPGGNLRPPNEFLLGTHPSSDGLALDAAREAGASLSHLDRMWNYAAGIRHPRPAWPDHGVSLIPPKSALWTDAKGARLGPDPWVSGFDTNDLVRRICAAPEGYSWQILNRRIAQTELAASGSEWNPALRDRRPLRFALDMLLGNKALVQDLIDHCPDVVTGRDVTELAARMNAQGNPVEVDAKRLEAELKAFDASLGKSDDPQRAAIETLRAWRGDRMRLARNVRIIDPASGPLIAIKERIVTRKSLGGLVTDLDSRVLDSAGIAIPGLYAAGEAAGFGGGGSHGHRALEGTFLLSCVLTARRAVAHLAGEGP